MAPKAEPEEWVSIPKAVERYGVISTTLYSLRFNRGVRAVPMPDDHPERQPHLKSQWLMSVADLDRWHADHMRRKERAQLRKRHRAELAQLGVSQ